MRRNAPLLALLLPFLLASCSGSRSCGKTVTAAEFTVCIGEGWEEVPEDRLREEGVPEETVAAFRRTDERAVPTGRQAMPTGRQAGRDNIVVSREALPKAAKARAYAEANVLSVASTAEYALIEKRETEIGGSDTLLHIFTARPLPSLPARRFYQVSLTKGATGYVFTGTLPFSVDEGIEEGLIEMISSVTLEE